MADDLKSYSPQEVAGFYRRLAAAVDSQKGAVPVSLSALLMNRWLDNRNPKDKFTFDPPPHLQSNGEVKSVMRYHRDVYLTHQKARINGSLSWAGIVPRLQDKRWNGQKPLSLRYHSLVSMPLSAQAFGSDADRDLLYALHDFQLETNVQVALRAGKTVEFLSFQAKVMDRYDWNPSKHITVPNPDFGSKASGAIKPDSKFVQVYHSNAKRVEAAGLAAPYDLESKQWYVLDRDVIKDGTIEPNKRLI